MIATEEKVDLLTLAHAVKLRAPCVYALCDIEGLAFYVGKTNRPWRRFQEHTWRGGHGNIALCAKIAGLGGDLRIAILATSPPSTRDEERKQIAARPWLLNLIGPNHWSWGRQAAKSPWMAGSGIVFPTRFIMLRMRKEKRAVCRAYLRRLAPAERCALEIELYQELPFFYRRRCDRWLSIVSDKMLACMESSKEHHGPAV